MIIANLLLDTAAMKHTYGLSWLLKDGTDLVSPLSDAQVCHTHTEPNPDHSSI